MSTNSDDPIQQLKDEAARVEQGAKGWLSLHAFLVAGYAGFFSGALVGWLLAHLV